MSTTEAVVLHGQGGAPTALPAGGGAHTPPSAGTAKRQRRPKTAGKRSGRGKRVDLTLGAASICPEEKVTRCIELEEQLEAANGALAGVAAELRYLKKAIKDDMRRSKRHLAVVEDIQSSVERAVEFGSPRAPSWDLEEPRRPILLTAACSPISEAPIPVWDTEEDEIDLMLAGKVARVAVTPGPVCECHRGWCWLHLDVEDVEDSGVQCEEHHGGAVGCFPPMTEEEKAEADAEAKLAFARRPYVHHCNFEAGNLTIDKLRRMAHERVAEEESRIDALLRESLEFQRQNATCFDTEDEVYELQGLRSADWKAEVTKAGHVFLNARAKALQPHEDVTTVEDLSLRIYYQGALRLATILSRRVGGPLSPKVESATHMNAAETEQYRRLCMLWWQDLGWNPPSYEELVTSSTSQDLLQEMRERLVVPASSPLAKANWERIPASVTLEEFVEIWMPKLKVYFASVAARGGSAGALSSRLLLWLTKVEEWIERSCAPDFDIKEAGLPPPFRVVAPSTQGEHQANWLEKSLPVCCGAEILMSAALCAVYKLHWAGRGSAYDDEGAASANQEEGDALPADKAIGKPTSLLSRIKHIAVPGFWKAGWRSAKGAGDRALKAVIRTTASAVFKVVAANVAVAEITQNAKIRATDAVVAAVHQAAALQVNNHIRVARLYAAMLTHSIILHSGVANDDGYPEYRQLIILHARPKPADVNDFDVSDQILSESAASLLRMLGSLDPAIAIPALFQSQTRLTVVCSGLLFGLFFAIGVLLDDETELVRDAASFLKIMGITDFRAAENVDATNLYAMWDTLSAQSFVDYMSRLGPREQKVVSGLTEILSRRMEKKGIKNCHKYDSPDPKAQMYHVVYHRCDRDGNQVQRAPLPLIHSTACKGPNYEKHEDLTDGAPLGHSYLPVDGTEVELLLKGISHVDPYTLVRSVIAMMLWIKSSTGLASFLSKSEDATSMGSNNSISGYIISKAIGKTTLTLQGLRRATLWDSCMVDVQSATTQLTTRGVCMVNQLGAGEKDYYLVLPGDLFLKEQDPNHEYHQGSRFHDLVVATLLEEKLTISSLDGFARDSSCFQFQKKYFVPTGVLVQTAIAGPYTVASVSVLLTESGVGVMNALNGHRGRGQASTAWCTYGNPSQKSVGDMVMYKFKEGVVMRVENPVIQATAQGKYSYRGSDFVAGDCGSPLTRADELIAVHVCLLRRSGLAEGIAIGINVHPPRRVTLQGSEFISDKADAEKELGVAKHMSKFMDRVSTNLTCYRNLSDARNNRTTPFQPAPNSQWTVHVTADSADPDKVNYGFYDFNAAGHRDLAAAALAAVAAVKNPSEPEWVTKWAHRVGVVVAEIKAKLPELGYVPVIGADRSVYWPLMLEVCATDGKVDPELMQIVRDSKLSEVAPNLDGISVKGLFALVKHYLTAKTCDQAPDMKDEVQHNSKGPTAVQKSRAIKFIQMAAAACDKRIEEVNERMSIPLTVTVKREPHKWNKVTDCKPRGIIAPGYITSVVCASLTMYEHTGSDGVVEYINFDKACMLAMASIRPDCNPLVVGLRPDQIHTEILKFKEPVSCDFSNWDKTMPLEVARAWYRSVYGASIIDADALMAALMGDEVQSPLYQLPGGSLLCRIAGEWRVWPSGQRDTYIGNGVINIALQDVILGPSCHRKVAGDDVNFDRSTIEGEFKDRLHRLCPEFMTKAMPPRHISLEMEDLSKAYAVTGMSLKYGLLNGDFCSIRPVPRLEDENAIISGFADHGLSCLPVNLVEILRRYNAHPLKGNNGQQWFDMGRCLSYMMFQFVTYSETAKSLLVTHIADNVPPQWFASFKAGAMGVSKKMAAKKLVVEDRVEVHLQGKNKNNNASNWILVEGKMTRQKGGGGATKNVPSHVRIVRTKRVPGASGAGHDDADLDDLNLTGKDEEEDERENKAAEDAAYEEMHQGTYVRTKAPRR